MIDLHTHSTYSDGTVAPGELVCLAAEAGLTAVALCDHNTVNGLPEFIRAAGSQGVQGVAGVEFSTEYEGRELHILALFLEPEHYPAVKARLAAYLERKERSNRELIARLARAGIDLDYDRIKAAVPRGLVNRAVIGAEMVRLGYCQSVQEAFEGWLDPRWGFYEPVQRPDAFDTIRFIRSLGAVCVLAHPFLDLSREELLEFLPRAKKCGLDAMETEYPIFTREQRGALKALAAEYGLLESGGSDFHGANKPGIRLGTGTGDLQVPDLWLEMMKKHKNRRKNLD